MGRSAAVTTVVLARSYSRYSGSTSLDSVTASAGQSAAANAATRCSCAGLA